VFKAVLGEKGHAFQVGFEDQIFDLVQRLVAAPNFNNGRDIAETLVNRVLAERMDRAYTLKGPLDPSEISIDDLQNAVEKIVQEKNNAHRPSLAASLLVGGGSRANCCPVAPAVAEQPSELRPQSLECRSADVVDVEAVAPDSSEAIHEFDEDKNSQFEQGWDAMSKEDQDECIRKALEDQEAARIYAEEVCFC
jgi:hypothetical protein